MYWDRVQRGRVSRRRLLGAAGAGALGAGAVGLIGCGGGGEEKAGQTAHNAPAGAGAAKRGGRLQLAESGSPPHLDPVLTSAGPTVFAIGNIYSRLVKPRSGAGIDPWDFTLEPDLSASYEQPDKTTYIFKLRPGAKWQNKPPLNGRDFTADDVVYSFRRGLDHPQSAIKGEFTMIDSVRAVNPQTVEIKTKDPLVTFIGKMGGNQLWMTPREVVEQKGDLKEVAIGTGPFMLESNTANVSLEYSRNPTYYGAPLPNVDGQTRSIIPDASAREAAFTTGKVDYMDNAGDKRARDRLARNIPDLQSAPVENVGSRFYFRCDRAPFQDVRLRQAFALTVDYDGLVQAFAAGEGAPGSLVPQGLKDWALPPSQWGEGAKYHSKPDIAEAKRLMAAAGFPNGLETEMYTSIIFQGTNQTGSVLEAVVSGAEKAGFKIKMNIEEYAVYTQRISGLSEYNGLLYLPTAPLPDPDDWIYTYLYPGARRFASFHKDPDLEALILKQRQEFDKETRKKIIADIERRNLAQNYLMPLYSFKTYAVWQKRVQNFSPELMDWGRGWTSTLWLQA